MYTLLFVLTHDMNKIPRCMNVNFHRLIKASQLYQNEIHLEQPTKSNIKIGTMNKIRLLKIKRNDHCFHDDIRPKIAFLEIHKKIP